MKNARIIVAAVLLIAYIAILLQLIVFKYPGVHFLPEYNLVPLKTILPYLSGRPNWIVARNNLLGNIIPFIPLGFIAPFLYRPLRWKHIFVVAVVFSLAIEVTQLVSRTGIFDVDDILLNIVGVMIGYALIRAISKKRGYEKPV